MDYKRFLTSKNYRDGRFISIHSILSDEAVLAVRNLTATTGDIDITKYNLEYLNKLPSYRTCKESITSGSHRPEYKCNLWSDFDINWDLKFDILDRLSLTKENELLKNNIINYLRQVLPLLEKKHNRIFVRGELKDFQIIALYYLNNRGIEIINLTKDRKDYFYEKVGLFRVQKDLSSNIIFIDYSNLIEKYYEDETKSTTKVKKYEKVTKTVVAETKEETEEEEVEVSIDENQKDVEIISYKSEAKLVDEDMVKEHFTEDTKNFKPFQFNHYTSQVVNLEGTYRELSTYLPEQIFFREGFKIDNENSKIYIPTYFMKINGLPTDRSEFETFIYSLSKIPNTKIITNVKDLFTASEYESFQNRESSSKTSSITDCFKKIDKLFLSKNIIKNLKITIQEIYNSKNLIINFKRDKFIKIIDTCLTSCIQDMLTVFDYTAKNPKIILATSIVGMPIREVYMLLLLHRLCFDIIIFTPKGQVTIEKYFEENLYTLEYVGNLDNVTLNIENIIDSVEKEEKEKQEKQKTEELSKKLVKVTKSKKEKKDNIFVKAWNFFQ